jgi:beta-propeller repeat-containing protein
MMRRNLLGSALAFLSFACGHADEPLPSGASATGAGGAGGGGGGGSAPCEPGATEACPYDGPAAAEGVGPCVAATRTCAADGSWGSCAGEVLPAIENCATPEDESCDGQTPACSGDSLWMKSYGDVDWQVANGLAGGANSRLVLVGQFYSSIDLGGGSLTSKGARDVFVGGLDATGSYRFSAAFGGSGTEWVGAKPAPDGSTVVLVTFDAELDLGDVTLSSAGASDFAVLRLDALGNLVFHRQFGGSGNDFPQRIVLDGAGNIYILGNSDMAIDLGGGPLPTSGMTDPFLVELDADGNHLWSKRFGGTESDYGFGLDVATDGSLVITGVFSGAIDFGGGPLETSDPNGAGFLARLDNGGAHVWSRIVEVASDHTIVAADGGVVVAGSFSGTIDFGGGPMTASGPQDGFLMKRDAAGSYLWSRQIGGIGDERCRVIEDPVGHLLLSCRFDDDLALDATTFVTAGSTDLMIAKMDASGATLWARQIGGPDEDEGGLQVDELGNPFVVGGFSGSVDYGAGPFASVGYWDAFILKLAP